MAVLHPEAEFRAFLAEGRFMIQRAKDSGRHVFYPRVAEPGTGGELEWTEASGHGTVHAVTTIHPRPPAEPYNVSLIRLAEGPQLMSRVEGLPAAEVRIGMKVRARIADENGAPLIVFDPE